MYTFSNVPFPALGSEHRMTLFPRGSAFQKPNGPRPVDGPDRRPDKTLKILPANA